MSHATAWAEFPGGEKSGGKQKVSKATAPGSSGIPVLWKKASETQVDLGRDGLTGLHNGFKTSKMGKAGRKRGDHAKWCNFVSFQTKVYWERHAQSIRQTFNSEKNMQVIVNALTDTPIHCSGLLWRPGKWLFNSSYSNYKELVAWSSIFDIHLPVTLQASWRLRRAYSTVHF